MARHRRPVDRFPPKSEIRHIYEDEYRRVFDTNVWGVLNSMRHEIPVMLKNGSGAIVNNSSVGGHVGFAEVSIYIASKHAVEGLTKSLALEFAKQNVRINAVAPGPIATDMWDRFVGEAAEQITGGIPVGRVGTPNKSQQRFSIWRRTPPNSRRARH